MQKSLKEVYKRFNLHQPDHSKATFFSMYKKSPRNAMSFLQLKLGKEAAEALIKEWFNIK